MLLPLIAIIAGFAVLAWGADRLVVGAAGTARNLGFSRLFVGLTVVALGTSAPEMLVSAIAAWNGNPGLAVGNALGSNITNSALVLGAAAMIAPLQFSSPALRREFPVLLFIMAVAWWLLRDGVLGRVEGGILIAGVVPLLWWMFHIGRTEGGQVVAAADEATPKQLSLRHSLIWLAVGLVALVVSSRVVVWGALGIAEHFGISDTVVGLSIVAIGTSLPELAASVVGATKGEHEIAVGNVLGSNMFNLLVVLGLPGIIAPAAIDESVLARDYPVMAGITLALIGFAMLRRGPPRLERVPGGLLVIAFCAYIALLYDKVP